VAACETAGGALSDSRLFYGIPVGEEQAGSIKCFGLLAAAAFALAGVRACPQRACQTVRAVCRRVRIGRIFLPTEDIFGEGLIADSRGCDVFGRFCKPYGLCLSSVSSFSLGSGKTTAFLFGLCNANSAAAGSIRFFPYCNTYKNCFSSAYCKSDCVVL